MKSLKSEVHPTPESIQKFVDGECEVTEYGWIALHLGECAECYRVYMEAATVAICRRLAGGL